jgi:iron complex transport system substrate-binding protein
VVAQVEADFKLLAERTARIKKPLRALFVLAVQNGRAVVGGQATSADAILRLAGAENVAAAVNGFRPLPDEALVELAPEVVVTMRRSSGSARRPGCSRSRASPCSRRQQAHRHHGRLYLWASAARSAAARSS